MTSPSNPHKDKKSHRPPKHQMTEAQFRGLLESVPDAMVIVNKEGRIVMINAQTEKLFGYNREKLLGKPVEILIPERFRDRHVGHRAGYLSDPHARPMGICLDLGALRKDGTEFPVDVSLSYLRMDGDILALSTVRDITQRKQAEEMIQRTAYYDALTGLPNRSMLYNRLLNAIRADNEKGKPLALLLMDLNRFKEINDTLGHRSGDLLLKQVGQRLKGALYEKDTVARLGGDEFGILLPLAESGHAAVVANRVQKTLEPPFLIEDLPIYVEAGIGIALYPDHGADAEVLMQHADTAMYRIKQSGSGYAIYDPKLDPHSPRRLALMGELREAIDRDQLFLHYQPKVGLKAGRLRLIGVEALVRWNHPKQGLIPPDQFIAPAEQTGLIRPLTRWVLNTALRQCQGWRREHLELPVSVNLSARHLQDPQLPKQVAELLRSWNVEPAHLELEITESVIMADSTRSMEVLTRLDLMGIRLAIDDFGTGYSSLAYLSRLPVETIKIDKSFVIGMTTNENASLIVQSIIELVHTLGMTAVAEGVENKETLDRLVALGCDAAQGYYLSRPLPAEELTRWLKGSPFGTGEG